MAGPSLSRSATFTRPANTTQYAAGDLVANSTTAGSVALMSWAFGGAGLWLRQIRLTKSDPDIVSSSFRLWLINDSAVTFTNGDNGALALSSGLALADVCGVFDLTIDKSLTGVGDTGFATFDPELYYLPATTYGFLEARATYTPGSAEVVTCYLRGDPY